MDIYTVEFTVDDEFTDSVTFELKGDALAFIDMLRDDEHISHINPKFELPKEF